MSRFVGRKENLNYDKVQQFFARRSAKIEEFGLLKITMYQSEQLAKLRDEHEKEIILPKLKLSPESRVFDIGCGTGRWGHHIASKIGGYLGVDSCDVYVREAQRVFDTEGLSASTHCFQRLGTSEITASAIAISPPFDVFIVAGLMTFLNDGDLHELMEKITAFASRRAVIYVREPIGLEQRLTLKDHFSQELNEYYHAIYRTADEYRASFDETLLPLGFRLTHDAALFPDELKNRKETEQWSFVLERGA